METKGTTTRSNYNILDGIIYAEPAISIKKVFTSDSVGVDTNALFCVYRK